ncbi:MAG: carboxypeptidase regulatory-like domain-containing protein [Fuerstiella sp.]
MKSYAIFGFGLLLLAGCSTQPQMDYSKADLVEVTGKVTLDGVPLSFAVLSFDSPDGQFSFAMTDVDGAYQLQFDSEMTGCTKGPKVVRVSTHRKILGLNVAEEGGDGGEEETNQDAERIPECYNKESELKVTVTESDTNFNFELNGD